MQPRQLNNDVEQNHVEAKKQRTIQKMLIIIIIKQWTETLMIIVSIWSQNQNDNHITEILRVNKTEILEY